MRILLCVALLASVAFVAGCGIMPMSPVMAPIVIDQKGPVAGFDYSAAATKTGRAEAEGILIVGWGDASITAAAASAGITKISHVDSETLGVLGIYGKYTTIVYGE